RSVPGVVLFAAGVDDRRYPPQPLAIVACWRLVRPPFSGLDFERVESEFLFRWYVATDRCWRGHGHGSAARSTIGHAQLRGLRSKGPAARTALADGDRRSRGRASAGEIAGPGDFSRRSGTGKGHPGERAGAEARRPAR